MRTYGLGAALVLLLSALPLPSFAADNAALGGVGGVNNGTLLNGDGTGGARISLFSVRPTLVKQARDPSGGVLPDGADVASGDEIYFVLYVDNPADHPATDARLTDLLDETAFRYVAGSLERAVVPSGSDDATIWAGTWSTLSDVVGLPDDDASAVDTGGPAEADRVTIGAVIGQANRVVDVPARSTLAVRFRVRVN